MGAASLAQRYGLTCDNLAFSLGGRATGELGAGLRVAGWRGSLPLGGAACGGGCGFLGCAPAVPGPAGGARRGGGCRGPGGLIGRRGAAGLAGWAAGCP